MTVEMLTTMQLYYSSRECYYYKITSSPLNGVTSVLPGAKPTGTPLENLGTFTGDSFTWNVDIAASKTHVCFSVYVSLS